MEISLELKEELDDMIKERFEKRWTDERISALKYLFFEVSNNEIVKIMAEKWPELDWHIGIITNKTSKLGLRR